MENVLLVVHILTCIALIGVVLLQRSEGGALGIGGGGGGGLMSGRGAASVLTRVTMILAAVFFVTSLTLTTIATRSAKSESSLATDVERITEDSLDLPTDTALPSGDSLDAPTELDLPADINAVLDSAPDQSNGLDIPAEGDAGEGQPD